LHACTSIRFFFAYISAARERQGRPRQIWKKKD
jgi:hypothetical protein